jgi:ankyrin repeat protein
MMWAAIGGHVNTVELLVDHSASMNLRNTVWYALCSYLWRALTVLAILL